MRGHGVEGNDTFKLTEVLNLLHTQKRTGRLIIHGEGRRGEIFLVDGKITHALVGPCVGLKALFFMLSWKRAESSFTPKESADKTTIEMKTSQVLKQLSQQMQEWAMMDEDQIPDPNSIIRLLPRARGMVRLKKEEWEVLAKIDGKKTVKQLCDDLYLPPMDLIKRIHRFLEAGLIGEAHPYRERVYTDMGEEFLSALEGELSLAVGPVAPMLMEETLRDLDEGDVPSNQQQKMGTLLEKLSNAIPEEEKRIQFQKASLALAQKFAKDKE